MLKHGVVLWVLLAGSMTAQDAVNTWIRATAIPLTTPVAGHGFADMQPLKRVIGDARIVSLGEATHGTREFFQLKHRMLEFLATEMGFTIFSIEANMPEAYKLNEFVENGNGDPVKLIKGMYFWTWDTQEVLDMVVWMRDFNKSGKGHVQFTGFDMQTPNVANQIVRDFVAKADPDYVATLAKASALALAPSVQQQQPFGTANGSYPVQQVLGKTLKFSGSIKTDSVSGYAGFWWRADVKGKPAGFRNLGDSAPKGTTDWKRFDLELPVTADADVIYWGPLLAGSGTAWFKDMKIEIDGKGEAVDPHKLNPTMGIYKTDVDDGVLRISRAATAADPKAVDPKLAAAEWTEVVKHLEGAKASAWIVQNARVVLQCMQMRANLVSRDESMATNVKWILDQSPKAKIVLWAHNGHVNSDMNGAMGTHLRKIYGDQMRVFGFAFNQGSFQAIEQNKGLHDFTIPPAPASSLDATLAASGIPLMALDLRAAPKTGVVRDWLQSAHTTRSIGAVYSEASAGSFMASHVMPNAFDSILFVDKTTAARKNGPAASDFQLVDGTYRDSVTGVSVKLPSGWKIDQVGRWGDHENTALLMGPDGLLGASLYYKMGAGIGIGDPEKKAEQRIREGLLDWKVREGSVKRNLVGGQAAVSCLADFTKDGEKMVEYLTWVSGKQSSALFFTRAPAAEVEALQKKIDPIIETLKLP